MHKGAAPAASAAGNIKKVRLLPCLFCCRKGRVFPIRAEKQGPFRCFDGVCGRRSAASAPSLPDLAALCLLPQAPRNRRTCAGSLAQCRSDQNAAPLCCVKNGEGGCVTVFTGQHMLRRLMRVQQDLSFLLGQRKNILYKRQCSGKKWIKCKKLGLFERKKKI